MQSKLCQRVPPNRTDSPELSQCECALRFAHKSTFASFASRVPTPFWHRPHSCWLLRAGIKMFVWTRCALTARHILVTIRDLSCVYNSMIHAYWSYSSPSKSWVTSHRAHLLNPCIWIMVHHHSRHYWSHNRRLKKICTPSVTLYYKHLLFFYPVAVNVWWSHCR